MDRKTNHKSSEIFGGKRQLRAETIADLEQLSDTLRVKKSCSVVQRLLELPEFAVASTVMCYVASSLHKEVETRQIIETAWAQGKTLIVPYCEGHRNLGLFRLKSWDELEPGRYGILEPSEKLRREETRKDAPPQIDTIILPGVALDKRGRRLGRGGGYYDRFLEKLPDKTVRIAMIFEQQIHQRIPVESHDQSVHLVVTDKNVYRCRCS